jgi:hypothetical protein
MRLPKFRLAIALAAGLAEPYLEIAWKCRAGLETTEACVWGRAYMPLSRVVGLVLIAPVVFVALTFLSVVWTRRHRGSPNR